MATKSVGNEIYQQLSCFGIHLGELDLLYHIKTIWLFTRSDLKTILIPSAVFGLANAAALSLNWQPLLRLPFVVFWIWLNLCPFDIGNQRSSSAIAEDLLNKPWRPMPSGRISQKQAKIVMLIGYVSAVVGSMYLGGLLQCVLLLGLGTWYNDFGGADYNSIVRNFINACGYLCFLSGALNIAYPASPLLENPKIVAWLFILAGIILTTVHSQDLGDQEGDSIRGRKTVPLELGDLPARLAICILVPTWSAICLQFWQPSVFVIAWHVFISALVAVRTFVYRTAETDNKTFKFWNLWVASIFVLPLCTVFPYISF